MPLLEEKIVCLHRNLMYDNKLMIRIRTFYICFIGILICASCNKPQVKHEFTSFLDSVSYSLGMLYAHKLPQNLSENYIDSISYSLFVEAMHDYFNQNKQNRLTNEEIQYITQKVQHSIQKKSDSLFIASHRGNIEKGKQFLQQNKEKAGVIEITEGLQYRTIFPGWGQQRPLVEDTVLVFYRVYSITDELLFDSRTISSQPIAIALDSAITAWQKILPLYVTGGRTRIYTSHEFAFGSLFSEDLNIPPFSTLQFDIELYKFIRSNRSGQTQVSSQVQEQTDTIQ